MLGYRGTDKKYIRIGSGLCKATRTIPLPLYKDAGLVATPPVTVRALRRASSNEYISRRYVISYIYCPRSYRATAVLRSAGIDVVLTYGPTTFLPVNAAKLDAVRDLGAIFVFSILETILQVVSVSGYRYES